MPTVRGPLFALNATGTLADLLTFRQGRNGVTVHPKQRPKTRHSSVELANRVLIAGLNLGWSTMNDYTRNLWGHTPRSTFIAHNATLANANQPWGSTPELTPTGSPMAPAAVTGTPGDALTVTGTLSPDATGTYEPNGTYNTATAYERADGNWWIWFYPNIFPGFDGHLITQELGETSPIGHWLNISGTPTGEYTAIAPATGTATGHATPTPSDDPATPLFRSIRLRYQNPDSIVGRTDPDWLTEVYLTKTATAQPPAHANLAAMALALPLATTKTLYLTGLTSGATYSIAMRNRNKSGDISPLSELEEITVI